MSIEQRLRKLEAASGATGCQTHRAWRIPIYDSPEEAPEPTPCPECHEPLMRIVVVFPQSIIDAGLAVVDPAKSELLGRTAYSVADGRQRELRGILEERQR